MSDLNFSGFFYIEGDTTNGFIDKALSYDDNLANNQATRSKKTYSDLIAKLNIPVVLCSSSGLYNMKYIVEENNNHTRTNINPNDLKWKHVFAIANYIYNEFYVFSGKAFAPIDGHLMYDYINGVLAKEIDDPNLNSTDYFGSYIKDSLQIFHVDENVSSTYYYRCSHFKFQIRWSDEVYNFDFWVNPESFITEWKSINQYIYIYYNYDNDDQRDSITEISENIANRVLPHYKKVYVTAVLQNTSTDSEDDDESDDTYEVDVPFYIWSNGVIPADVFTDPTFLNAIREKIKTTENTLSLNDLAVKYPQIFEEADRIIYPLTDNDSIDETDYLDQNDNPLVVTPLSVNEVNDIIQDQSCLVNMKAFETSSVYVGDANIPFIVAGIKQGALTDKVPFYRASIDQIKSLSGYDRERIQTAVDFNKILSAIFDYQINGTSFVGTILDNIEHTETDESISFVYLGINWRVINRSYNPDNITEEP